MFMNIGQKRTEVRTNGSWRYYLNCCSYMAAASVKPQQNAKFVMWAKTIAAGIGHSTPLIQSVKCSFSSNFGISVWGQGQTSNFSCAEPNVNELSSLSSLFHICIRFGTWKVRRLTVAWFQFVFGVCMTYIYNYLRSKLI
jgi:hypothetical protein